MEDFNDYAKKDSTNNKSVIETVTDIAKKFDGKSTNDLLKAVYQEAEKGKREGTLTNEKLDSFAAFIAPMLDDKKRKMLYKVIEKLKEV